MALQLRDTMCTAQGRRTPASVGPGRASPRGSSAPSPRPPGRPAIRANARLAHCTCLYLHVFDCICMYLGRLGSLELYQVHVCNGILHVCCIHTCQHTCRYKHICIASRQCICVCIFVMNTGTCAFLKAVHTCMYLTVSDCISQCISVCICLYLTVFCCHIHSHMHQNCGVYCPKSAVRSSRTHENQSESAKAAAGVGPGCLVSHQVSRLSRFVFESPVMKSKFEQKVKTIMVNQNQVRSTWFNGTKNVTVRAPESWRGSGRRILRAAQRFAKSINL